MNNEEFGRLKNHEAIDWQSFGLYNDFWEVLIKYLDWINQHLAWAEKAGISFTVMDLRALISLTREIATDLNIKVAVGLKYDNYLQEHALIVAILCAIEQFLGLFEFCLIEMPCQLFMQGAMEVLYNEYTRVVLTDMNPQMQKAHASLTSNQEFNQGILSALNAEDAFSPHEQWRDSFEQLFIQCLKEFLESYETQDK